MAVQKEFIRCSVFEFLRGVWSRSEAVVRIANVMMPLVGPSHCTDKKKTTGFLKSGIYKHFTNLLFYSLTSPPHLELGVVTFDLFNVIFAWVSSRTSAARVCDAYVQMRILGSQPSFWLPPLTFKC